MKREKRKLLVVDDDTGIQRQLRWSFEGYNVEVAGDRDEALARFRNEMPAVCTVDLGLPPDPDSPDEGFLIVEEMLRLAPETKIIVVWLDNTLDDVRLEIEAGRQHNLPIFPVLVGENPMPRENQLPESIQFLSTRNALPSRVMTVGK